MTDAPRRRVFTGVTLIVLGAGLYALRYWGDIDQAATLFLIGGAFLAAYFYQGQFAFLVPACLFLGVGGGQFLDVASSIGLGSGFLAITVIALAYERRFHWWPLIPGGVLLIVGFERVEWVRLVFDHWPLLLVVGGILLLFAGRARPASS